MHGYLPRQAQLALNKALNRAPAVLLVGPRQCGKSTLARQLLAEHGNGLLLDLLDIDNYDDLLAHPQAGESREGFVIEQLIAAHPRWRPHFLRTSHGAELDLVLERGQRRRVYEIKLSKAPKVSRGFHELVEQLQPEQAELIAPVDASFEIRPGIWARSPLEASSPAIRAGAPPA